MPRIELRRVSRTYESASQKLIALHEVSLSIEAGKVTALLGRSGCGKSTLLNMAGAMDFPTSGDVLIDGRSTSVLAETELTALRRTRIGFVFQFFQLLPTLTVFENVELPLLLSGSANSARTALDRLKWVGLDTRGASLPHQLSGGQMQRVAVARALVQSPGILIADEPTGNLDTASGDQVLALMSRAANEFGAVVLIATHSLEAAAIAHTRVHLKDGRIDRTD
ncbi:MAG: ABC transporter ATP-binding protein [Acidobacteriota bacterium]|nr:ABC transporter ATP-binding protein [Acidobacteriota bacterium]